MKLTQEKYVCIVKAFLVDGEVTYNKKTGKIYPPEWAKTKPPKNRRK